MNGAARSAANGGAWRPASAAAALLLIADLMMSSAPCAAAAAAKPGVLRREDLEVVDCLLPGQVRQLGAMTYLTARRPTHTTAADCRIRGGEYVAFDRADLQSALRVWQQAAEAGDAEAQTNVAEIYERGQGGAPNYEAAVLWYRKAAEQKYARALFNLGTLYEQGLGVEEDKLQALNLYRQAWGLPEDSVMYQSAARDQQAALRAALSAQVAEKDQQLKLLQSQLESLQQQASQAAAAAAAQRAAAARGAASAGADSAAAKAPASAAAEGDSQAEVIALKKWIAQLESERSAGNDKLNSLAQLRTPAAAAALPAIASQAAVRAVGKLNFGRYYALIIGNQHYELLQSLQTPLSDAEAAARVLQDKYGFTVQVLNDASDVAMLKALNDLNDVLKADDNLLIYYAGHGARLQNTYQVAGYWLPVNSEAPPKDTFWVPNEQVTAHLARIAARRVLVVADSCYAGLLSTDPSYLFAGGAGGYTNDYIAYKLPKRARLLISSGGDEPVLDAGGGGNSVFSRAFVAELAGNESILPAPELFSRVARRVAAGAAQNKFVQQPEFKSIKGAGHEVGDFFFVPQALK